MICDEVMGRSTGWYNKASHLDWGCYEWKKPHSRLSPLHILGRSRYSPILLWTMAYGPNLDGYWRIVPGWVDRRSILIAGDASRLRAEGLVLNLTATTNPAYLNKFLSFLFKIPSGFCESKEEIETSTKGGQAYPNPKPLLFCLRFRFWVSVNCFELRSAKGASATLD